MRNNSQRQHRISERCTAEANMLEPQLEPGFTWSPAKIRPSSSSSSTLTSEDSRYPSHREILAALGDVSAIESHATLQADMVNLSSAWLTA